MFTGLIPELGSPIAQLQPFLSISSPSHPRHPFLSLTLATERLIRYVISHQMEDLDEAICHFTQSILLQPLSWLRDGSMILRVLYFLATALLMRSKKPNQPEDAISAAKYLFYLRNQPRVISGLPRQTITALLVEALALPHSFHLRSGLQTSSVGPRSTPG